MIELRRRLGRALGRPTPAAPTAADERLDDWLETFAGAELRRIDAAVAGAGPEAFAAFRDLEEDLWALLLTQAYEGFGHIRALLPDVPDPELQRLWNGCSGVALAVQSAGFVRRLRGRVAAHGDVPLADARVLDFGCGWGRLTRHLARELPPGMLFGCDPVEAILDVCRQTRVPATLARSEFVPVRVPFDEPFDLAFAFSVFTHLSERAHEHCLDALHAALRPGGLLVVTVRAPAYGNASELLSGRTCELADPAAPAYVFAPHPAEPTHFQYDGGEMTYGETIVTLPYVRERWSPRFELLAVDLQPEDLHQVVLTLRRSR